MFLTSGFLAGFLGPEAFDIPVLVLLLTIAEAPVGLLGRQLRPLPTRLTLASEVRWK